MQPIFFKPNTTMIKWLVKYANNRIVIDAGCGEKFILLQQLIANGHRKCVGIDPQIDFNEYTKFKMLNMDKDLSIHLLPKKIEDYSSLYDGSMKHQDVLLIFARPCHSNFVEEALNLKGKNVEALYITVPNNIDEYNDLGKHKKRAVLIKHEGKSADEEVVYSIK